MNASPKDLAQKVFDVIKSLDDNPPSLESLTELFEVMYFASLKTEEAQPISFHVAYIDPENPDPDPPERVVNDRWNYVPLSTHIPATIPNFVKIAKASDPRSSSFAVYYDKKRKWFIHGLIDQGNNYYDFINHNVDSGQVPPGLFHSSIAGTAHLIATIGHEKIAELKVNALKGKTLDVFARGPVYEALWPGIERYIFSVFDALDDHVYEERDHWPRSLISYWLKSLRRLVLRAQNYGHGGAFLVSPDLKLAGLNPKYTVHYPRLRTALHTKGRVTIERTYASDSIYEITEELEHDLMPTELYLDETVASAELEDNRSEIDSAIWFVSLLSRVDGCVLLTPDLEVNAFGVEITVSEEPSEVFLAKSAHATKSKLSKVDYNHYGTRHRSMMRYCAQFPGSVGIVISQDGDVRVITKVEDKLIMWENVKLQIDDLSDPRRRRRKRHPE